MKCAHCGKEVPNSAKVCAHCGENPQAKASAKRPKNPPPAAKIKAKKPKEKQTQATPAKNAKKISPIIWIAGILLLVIAAAFLLTNNGSGGDEVAIENAIQLTVLAAEAKQVVVQASNTPASLPATATIVENTAVPSETSTLPPPTATVEIIPEQLAFASDRNGRPQIWVIHKDGNEERQITDVIDGACQPTWSPDGKFIAFTSPCLANRSSYPDSAVFTIELESGNIAQISFGGGDYDPAWSHAGLFVAYTSLRENNRSQIFIYDVANQSERPFSSIGVYEYQPSWSWDDEFLAFVSTAVGPELIYTTNFESPNRNQLLTELQADGKLISSPRWAQDGKAIYYTLTPRSGGFAQIYYLPTAGSTGQNRAFFAEAIPGRDASLSSDGEWIAIESWPNTSNHDIWIASLDGNNRTRLTTNTANDFDPAWRP